MNLFSRILRCPLLMSLVGVVLALSIMWRMADANGFRVNVPIYPGAQQVKIFGDSDKQVITFVTHDAEAQVREFYKESFSSEDWYHQEVDIANKQLCCYTHLKDKAYYPGSELYTSITVDYMVDIDYSSDLENTLVTVTAKNVKGPFNRVAFDYLRR